MKDAADNLLKLLTQEHRSLHAMLYRLTLDTHAAEDLLQELFVKLAATPAFSEAREPAAYIRRAAINLALDWRRAQSRRWRVIREQAGQEFSAPPAADRLAQEEQWQLMLDAAAALPGATREAFALHYLQQLSFSEVAHQMGKSPHQVRALCHKAIRQLREILSAAAEPCSQENHRATE